MAVKKKKVKKTPKATPPTISGWEYYIDEWPTAMTTADMQSRCDAVGAEGWELIFIGLYGSTEGHIRIWFKRQSSPAPVEGK